MKNLFSIFAFLFYSIPLFFLQSAQAQNPFPSICNLTVRVIQGLEQSNQVSGRLIPNDLSDLAGQLKPLAYNEYKMLSSTSHQLTLHTPKVLSIKGTKGELHSLVVESLGFENNKAHLRVDWRSPQNEKIVATRLRVPNKDHVVIGAEGTEDESMMLCLAVKCE